jgi:hypothetical protein
MLQTKDEIKTWLDEMKVTNYTINNDLTVDVDGDVDLIAKKLTKIPVQFGIINGGFSIWNNKLISLKGCPNKVKGNFDCTHNQLKSLEHCPKEIGENFCFHANEISTFEFLPDSVGTFTVYEDDIINLNFHELKIQVNKDFIHNCTSKKYCINLFKSLYDYENESYFKYGLYFSAQQFNSIILNNKLELELNKNNQSEKKIKI